MSPMLRGEALPLSGREIDELRETLARDYGDRVVETGAGPLLAVRVPYGAPDFLRDVEATADRLVYRDLQGFAGVVLVGDTHTMSVSADMLRSLVEQRVHEEREWAAGHRVDLPAWSFAVAKIASDPERRSRAVFRVDADTVADLDEPDFERLARMLPDVKRASPGRIRPNLVYLVAHRDHVCLDGARFFTEIEERARGRAEERERVRRDELEDRHAQAVAALERLRQRRAKLGHAGLDETQSPSVSPTAAASSSSTLPTRAAPAPRPMPPESGRPEPARPSDDLGLFKAADAVPEACEALETALIGAGYKVKRRLVVQGVPIRFAAARTEGYPTRVLVTFWGRLGPDDARRLIKMGRSVGVDLLLAVAAEVPTETERVALATNLKVVPLEAVPHVRFL